MNLAPEVLQNPLSPSHPPFFPLSPILTANCLSLLLFVVLSPTPPFEWATAVYVFASICLRWEGDKFSPSFFVFFEKYTVNTEKLVFTIPDPCVLSSVGLFSQPPICHKWRDSAPGLPKASKTFFSWFMFQPDFFSDSPTLGYWVRFVLHPTPLNVEVIGCDFRLPLPVSPPPFFSGAAKEFSHAIYDKFEF